MINSSNLALQIYFEDRMSFCSPPNNFSVLQEYIKDFLGPKAGRNFSLFYTDQKGDRILLDSQDVYEKLKESSTSPTIHVQNTNSCEYTSKITQKQPMLSQDDLDSVK